MVSTAFLQVLVTSISSILVAVSAVIFLFSMLSAAEALESASFVMGELVSFSLKPARFISSLPYCRVPLPNG
jgi:hypothetical protein